MNTPAIKPILDYFKVARDAIDSAQRATNTEERERIAELERDLAHEKAHSAESIDGVMQYLRLIEGDTLDEKVREVIRQRDEARANLAQSAAIAAELRAEVERLKASQAVWVDVSHAGAPAPVVEEQGPWVIGRKGVASWYFVNASTEDDWAQHPDAALDYESKETAESVRLSTQDLFGGPWQVITLAEARALVAAKTVAP